MTAGTDQSKRRPRTRASKETRKEQLVAAALRVIARNGVTATTLAEVADEAQLSRGIVNFHFDTKENLLLAALTELSRDYDAHWRRELASADGTPAARLRALIVADLSEAVCSPDKLAAWFGYFGETTRRPEYLDLCWAKDEGYMEALTAICRALEHESGYGRATDSVAMAIYALQEGLWLRLMLGSGELTREVALQTALSTLGMLFPKHFTATGDLL